MSILTFPAIHSLAVGLGSCPITMFTLAFALAAATATASLVELAGAPRGGGVGLPFPVPRGDDGNATTTPPPLHWLWDHGAVDGRCRRSGGAVV